MNKICLYSSIFSDLPIKLSEAGFTDGNIDTMLRKVQCYGFNNPPQGLLRWLYLAYLGLAEFTLKPGTVRMFSGEKYWEEELQEFQTPYHHKIHPDDEKYKWNTEFDLNKLTLHPAVPPNRHRKQITLKSALISFQKSVPENLRANYWHGMWLSLHQEFIPNEWKNLLRKEGGYRGRIIFPGVRLHPNNFPDVVQYPYLMVDSGGYNLNYYLDLQEMNYATHGIVGKNDHFACFLE